MDQRTGDIIWLVISAGLIFLMQPGYDTFVYNVNPAGGPDIVLADGTMTGNGQKTLVGFEAARITGDARDNVIDASSYSSNVTLIGLGGDDLLIGGSWHDRLDGGDGNDILEGRSGRDTLVGGRGSDSLMGNIGNDKLFGNSGADLIFGGDGDDKLAGGNGNDTLSGNLGNDTIAGNGGNDRFREIADVDFTLTNGHLIGVGNDVFSSEKVELIGGPGDNTIIASAYSGKATLDGAGGDDSIFGGAGNELLRGGDGDDQLSAGDGHDRLNGGDGNDQFTGGLGNDTIDGGEGRDRVKEEGDVDFVITDTHYTGVGIDEFSNIEKLNFKGGPSDNHIDASSSSVIVILHGRDGDDTLLGGLNDDTLNGNGDNDVLIGNAGNDRLNGGSDDDMLTGGLGNDTLAGKGGTDRIVETADVNFTLDHKFLHGLGKDRVVDVEEAQLAGGDSSNSIDVSKFLGQTTLIGNAGDDILTGGIGTDLFDARDGHDTVVGASGDDTILGTPETRTGATDTFAENTSDDDVPNGNPADSKDDEIIVDDDVVASAFADPELIESLTEI